jgi:hypothetical protein
MKFSLTILFVTVVLIIPANQIHAKEDKELHKQRQEAQKERQAKKSERSREIADAIKSFREFTQSLKYEYPSLLKDVDTEFELTQVDLEAERAAKIAEAEAEYQKKWTSLFIRPGGQMTMEALKVMEEEAKAHSNELFRIKEEAARIAHKETHSLGLTKKYEPILATPIGGELTRQENQWNEREEKETEKIHTQNLQIVREFKDGAKLREWELSNMDKDFQLTWDEKRELHTIESQQMFFNNFLLLSAQGAEINEQEIMAKFAELGKQTKLVKIKYDTMRKKNSITRRGEKKKLQEG